MRHDLVIPNLSENLEGTPSEVTKDNGNIMLNILNRLNESTETVPEADKELKTCSKCGVKYEGEGCPKCGTVVDECDEVPAKKEMTESFKRGKRRRMHESEDAGVAPEEVKDPEVAEEKPTTESFTSKKALRENDEDAGVNPEEVKDPEVAEEKKVNESTRYRLTRVLLEYCKLCEAEDFEKAKELIEEEEVEVTLDPDGTYEIKEADEEDETQKVTLTEEEIEDIEKVEESMSFGKSPRRINESRKLKKKATKAKARRSLSESYRKTRIINAVQKLAMQEGISFSSKKLQRVINEAYRINEAEVELPEEKAQTALEKAFNDAGVVVKECETEVNDGVLTAHLTLQDNDAEVFLGDVADEVAEDLDGYDVDYDEPEINEDDDEEVYVDFHFVPVITSEAEEVEDEESVTESEDEDELGECDEDPKTAAKVNESKKVRRGRKLTESEEVEDEETVNEEDEDEETIKVNEEDEDEDDVFESFAGSKANVRCKLNPAFIKPGQVIFDSESRTVFQAMTESVACKDGFELGIEVCNSANPKLSRLAPGAEVTLSSKGSYYLLRENPTK